jgi:hypothetical protein
MTAYALAYFCDKLIVAGDSRIYDDDNAGRGHGCKIYTLPTMRAVFFARGKMAITIVTVQQLLLSPTLHTVENAADALPGLLASGTAKWADALGVEVPPAGANIHECTLAGWSKS